jgi:hypothetical protein
MPAAIKEQTMMTASIRSSHLPSLPASITYYTRPGVMTDPGPHAHLLARLPGDLAGLVRVVQGNLLHVFWAERYGRQPSEAEKQTLNLRPLAQKLACIQAVDPAPLAAARPLEKRQIGNCRDFSLFLCALLQHQGLPARARCGFGAYFLPNHYEDHWVCEYWNAAQARWVLVDAQLDVLQCETLKPPFDPLDVPPDQFITAGRAWQMCRAGQAEAQHFGIFEMHGWWFIWGNVLRDFLALNKVEILPWDWWGSPYWSHRLEDPLPPQAELWEYDSLAALTLAGEAAFREIRARYEGEPTLQPPEEFWAEPGSTGNG